MNQALDRRMVADCQKKGESELSNGAGDIEEARHAGERGAIPKSDADSCWSRPNEEKRTRVRIRISTGKRGGLGFLPFVPFACSQPDCYVSLPALS